MCSVCISEQTATVLPLATLTDWFLTEMEGVYYAMQTGSLNKTVCVSPLNG
jgi:hypothetical protein